MSTATKESTAQDQTTLLTGADRCDACGARAYVRFFTKSGELQMCAHHFNKHEAIIEASHYVVHDERHQLTGHVAPRKEEF